MSQFTTKLACLFLALTLCGAGHVEFDQAEYVFGCPVPPEYDYFSIHLLYYGDPICRAWVNIEFNAPLDLRDKNITIGDSWFSEDDITITRYGVFAGVFLDSVAQVFITDAGAGAVPGKSLCVVVDLWSEAGNCYEGPIIARVFGESCGLHPAWTYMQASTALTGTDGTPARHGTWGAIKALFGN